MVELRSDYDINDPNYSNLPGLDKSDTLYPDPYFTLIGAVCKLGGTNSWAELAHFYVISAPLQIAIQFYFPQTLDFSVSSLSRIVRVRVVPSKTQPAFTDP